MTYFNNIHTLDELRKEYSPFFHFMDALLEQIKKSSSS